VGVAPGHSERVGWAAHAARMPAAPARCIHYKVGRTWRCKRCKTLDRNRGILGLGRCAHNKLLASCRACSSAWQREICDHGSLRRRCKQGCAKGASICPCGKRATECRTCAPQGVLCPHRRRWRQCTYQQCNRRGILQGNIVKLDYVHANLTDKNCEFKPPGSRCKWAFPTTGAPTILLCSMSDYPKIELPGQGCYPPHPCTHWAFGIVLYEQARFISNTKEQLPHEWRAWGDHHLRDTTIKRLGAQHRTGYVYGIRKRLLFPTPVAVRVTERNYGDGWIRSQDIELRTAIELPPWTRCSLPVRKVLAKDRPRARP